MTDQNSQTNEPNQPAQPAVPALPADWGDRVARYDRQFKVAAEALVAAIRADVTDGAETNSHLLATAAANLGGMHTLTAARPGSWEADYVDRFLASTVGPDGDYLLEYRTAPIEIVGCVDASMVDLDIAWIYDESFDLIDQAEYDTAPEHEDAGGGEAAREASIDRVARAEELIDQLRDRDYASYKESFEHQVGIAADELRRTRHLPDSVPVRVRWVEWAERAQATGTQEAWGTVEYKLWETAWRQTPPPGFTEPLTDIPGTRTPGDVLQATGRMPHQRIPELADYGQPTTHTDDKSAEPGRAGEQS
jgi:hypothetical protein